MDPTLVIDVDPLQNQLDTDVYISSLTSMVKLQIAKRSGLDFRAPNKRGAINGSSVSLHKKTTL